MGKKKVEFTLPWPIDQMLPGEWVVRHADGCFSTWHDDILKTNYKIIKEIKGDEVPAKHSDEV